MDETSPVQISTRPFLSDMYAESPSTAVAAAATPAEAPENSHLLAAVTGRRLHAVPNVDEQTSDAGPVAAPQPQAPTRRAGRTEAPTVSSTAAAFEGMLNVDWRTVANLTRQLELDESGQTRPRNSFDVATASAGPETAYEEATLSRIRELVRRHAHHLGARSGADKEWNAHTQSQYVQAVFDQAFRYGRLQQYLREPDIEDLSITGFDNVMVTKTSGRREQRPPVAESDDDLEQMISEIATYRDRSFARPAGHLDLDLGGARLSATSQQISEVTCLTIRRHNLVDIEVQDLVDARTITKDMAALLDAAVRANLCVIIGGYPGTGKTTTLRALMGSAPPAEKIVTIETERELYLNKMPHRHAQVQALQYIPPQFSSADARTPYSLEDAFHESLRSSAMRILFAEMRGPEAPIAIKAMQAGRGSMSTIHARSADEAIHRFADMLMSEQRLSEDTVPLRQIGRSVDLILYIDFVYEPNGTRRRVITEIAEVVPNGETQLPMAANLFEYDWKSDRYTSPERPSEALVKRLERVGFDATGLGYSR